MIHDVVITSVDHDGYEGIATFVVPGLYRHARTPSLTGHVVYVEPNATQEQVDRHFGVGGSRRFEINLWWTLDRWSSSPPGIRAITQSDNTYLTGQVVEVTDANHFVLECGLRVAVEMDRNLPGVGEWVRVSGALFLLEE